MLFKIMEINIVQLDALQVQVVQVERYLRTEADTLILISIVHEAMVLCPMSTSILNAGHIFLL